MRTESRAEEALPLLERDLEQRPPVEVKQVEGLVDGRRRRTRALRAGRATRADAGPILEEAEARPPGLVERDHLAVDDRVPRLDPLGGPRELGEVARRVLAVARPEPRAPSRITASTR